MKWKGFFFLLPPHSQTFSPNPLLLSEEKRNFAAKKKLYLQYLYFSDLDSCSIRMIMNLSTFM